MAFRLLIADDHEVVREGLRYTFAGTNIEIVSEAADCACAVRQAIDEHIDVVLLDLQMPGDGLQALLEIKAAKPLLPVVMYSAHDRPDLAHRCRELGAYTYLTKQVDTLTLLATVLEACERG